MSQTSNRTVAEQLVFRLQEAGTEIVFGLPGGENVEVMEALRLAGIRFVLVRNESSAIYMADVHARLTGKPAVCLTTLGPGATNAYVGLAHADLDRAPVLLITAETNQKVLPDHTHQVLDLQRVFEPVCKFTASLNPENVDALIVQALSEMKQGRVGPVHLSLSREVASQKVSVQSDVDTTSTDNSVLDTSEIAKAKESLKKSKRPLVIVGVGLEVQESVYASLQTFVEAIDSPVIVTPKAKGALSDRHPLATGTLGLTRTDPVYELIAEADCIVAVGFDVVELVLPWNDTQQDVELIWVSSVENVDPVLPVVAELFGDVVGVLEELGRVQGDVGEGWGEARAHSFRKTTRSVALPPPQKNRILPQTVLDILRVSLPDDILVTTDVGSHKICTALHWQAYTPNRYMLSNGLSAMGFGLSAAISGAITLNEATLCITGDAGFSMVMGELGLIAELDLPVIIVVMNDAALDLIRAAQNRAEKPSYGTEFKNPDFEHIAKAYDITYAKVDNEVNCREAIQQAYKSGKAILIDIWIDPISYPTTPQT